jgi:hypothetical protein
MMKSLEIDTSTWNRMAVALMQAMVGAISHNFRQVSLSYRGGQWRLGFVLAAESEEDREEIADIACEFEALQDGPVEYELTVQVTVDELEFPDPPGRVLFRRRES